MRRGETAATRLTAIPANSFKRQKCIYKEKKKTLFVSKQYFKSKSIELFFQIKNRLLENLFWKSSILAPIYWTKKLTQHFRNDGPISNWKSSCNHNSYMHRNWKGICKLKQLSQQKIWILHIEGYFLLGRLSKFKNFHLHIILCSTLHKSISIQWQ